MKSIEFAVMELDSSDSESTIRSVDSESQMSEGSSVIDYFFLSEGGYEDEEDISSHWVEEGAMGDHHLV